MRWIIGTFLIFSSTLVCASDYKELLDQVTEIESHFEQKGRYRRGDQRILNQVADLYEKETTPYLTSRRKKQSLDPEKNQPTDPDMVLNEIVDDITTLRSNSKTPSPIDLQNAFTNHPQFNEVFTSPVKVDSNTFHSSTRIYPSPDKETTPRRRQNMRRLINGKRPVAIVLFTNKIMKTEDHHVAQKRRNEVIVQTSKKFHKGNHGKLHYNFKKSEIDRVEFRRQQTKALKIRGVRDSKKYLEKKCLEQKRKVK